MVYTYGCIDIILKRSALDRNPKKNSQYLISSENIEEDYYDDDLICVPGGMSPADAESSVFYYEREYNIRIFDRTDPKHYVAKDGVIISGPYGTTTRCDWLRKEGYGWAYVQPSMSRDITWDPEKWLSEFKGQPMPDFHRIRERVFRNTQAIVENGGYVLNGKEIKISNPPASTLFKEEITSFGPINNLAQSRTIKVLNEDCLLTARKLASKNPLVLNMASRRNPGGGVEHGAGAQEECLFRSSNYYKTLYPLRSFYPLDRNFGGVYSPDVTVFRGLESDGYPLLENPFHVSFVAVAALNRPELTPNGDYSPSERRGMENKIRTILNIAATFNHKVLILSAFGCGAFKNPPLLVAELFKSILDEPQYSGRFEEVYFSIKPDHNDRQTMNFTSFDKVFRD